MQENSLPSISYKLKVVPRYPIVGGLEIGFFQELNIQSAWGDWREDTISIQVNDAIKKMFDEAPIGGDFDIRIVVKYDYQGLPSYEKSYPESPYVFAPQFNWTPVP